MLDERQGLEAHMNANKGWEGSRLLKAYDKGIVPPYDVVEIRCPQAPTPPSLIDRFLYSLAKCSTQYANLTHIPYTHLL